jgi:hypothetical protein
MAVRRSSKAMLAIWRAREAYEFRETFERPAVPSGPTVLSADDEVFTRFHAVSPEIVLSIHLPNSFSTRISPYEIAHDNAGQSELWRQRPMGQEQRPPER